MKIWIKYLFAVIIGTLIGVYVLETGDPVSESLSFLSTLTKNIGRYTVYPLVFFSLAYASYKLRIDRRIFVVYVKTILIILVSSVLLTVIGTAAVYLLSPERIPIIAETERSYSFPHIQEILLSTFPANLFKIFTGDGNFLLPLTVFSIFLGLNFSFDKIHTRPAIQLFDSFSRIFYHMSMFILEILGFGLVILSAAMVVTIRSTTQIEFYRQLLLLVGLLTAIIILGIYPLIVYFLMGKENPYKHLYAITAPALAAFLSGNSYFAFTTLIPHTMENLGIPRKIGATTLPIFTLFGKAGTAMVTSVTFMVILRSYSSLGIGIETLLWIAALSFLTSFLTGSVPGMGVVVSLSFICALYGRGIENGFLIVQPIVPLLISFAVLLDVVTAALGSVIVSHSEGNRKDIYASDFI
ncbi:MAG: cation:dicarboxylase symporter family transporter [Spirochaetia bacterium]